MRVGVAIAPTLTGLMEETGIPPATGLIETGIGDGIAPDGAGTCPAGYQLEGISPRPVGALGIVVDSGLPLIKPAGTSYFPLVGL